MMGFNKAQKEIFVEIKEEWAHLQTLINNLEDSNIKDIVSVILNYGSDCGSIKDFSTMEYTLEDIYPFVQRLPLPQEILNVMRKINHLLDAFFLAFFLKEEPKDDLFL